MICIGYIGIEAFDIILYIGKTLAMLNNPVLIIDLSETGALTKTIYHGMALDSESGIIHYREYNYIKRIPYEKELNDYSNGVVFVIYGLNYVEVPYIHLDYMNIITDPFPNNIERVNNCLLDISTDNTKVKVIVRDIISLDDLEIVKNGIMLSHRLNSINYLYIDINDRENAMQCQITQTVRFRKISSRMKKIIIGEVADILPNIKMSQILKAFNYAKKGVKTR